jgi:hypothetical protein
MLLVSPITNYFTRLLEKVVKRAKVVEWRHSFQATLSENELDILIIHIDSIL